jgi:hypothetical protein
MIKLSTSNRTGAGARRFESSGHRGLTPEFERCDFLAPQRLLATYKASSILERQFHFVTHRVFDLVFYTKRVPAQNAADQNLANIHP